MFANTDLHIHSRFSMASSPDMVPGALVGACIKKGIQVLGSGDALHPGWQKLWEEYQWHDKGVIVVPSTEVEDRDRVHQVILMESFSDFSELHSRLKTFSKDIATGGRPHVRLSGEELAGHVHEIGGLIGPAHAFTPWTSLYAYFDRLSECYGTETIDFLELGLSADSSYGAAISELYDIPFITNSDAHSPDPAKCGREFTTFDIKSLTVKNVLSALKNGNIQRNVGLFPEEGKYNRTACTRCFQKYTPEEAAAYHWRCPLDNGLIKLGVFDRAQGLSDGKPGPRPPYLHMIPLGEIIMASLNVSSTKTKKALGLYNELIGTFGNEIDVLTSTPVSEIREVHEGTAGAIDAFRNHRVSLHPGGGGQYGTFTLLPSS
ncbi:MAG TPA: PHP-associated domain-containing protein [Methanoregulaceae archaeon]|nr:PHP-associated domain-containing protein [Methanoregulaceae archaeon]